MSFSQSRMLSGVRNPSSKSRKDSGQAGMTAYATCYKQRFMTLSIISYEIGFHA